jgi:hypothetical protein
MPPVPPVDAFHVKLICDEEAADAESPLGTLGGVVTELTVRVAILLVTLPAVLLTTTVNCAPLSELVVAGVV